MMKLSKTGIKHVEEWNKAEIQLPQFDFENIKANTINKPQWIHFGAGNIFRGFIANAHQKLLNQGFADTGIIAVETFDFEVIDRVYKPYDDLSLLVLMQADGHFNKKVIASISQSIAADYTDVDAINRLETVFVNPSLQMISFTITEKGYALTKPDGTYLGIIKKDLEEGPNGPLHTMSMIAAFMYKRYLAGKFPVTLVSMDNCSHNGDKLKDAVLTISREWLKKGYVKPGFIDYLSDPSLVTFPLSMIDKITPRPSESVKLHLDKLDIEDMDVVITEKRSYMAPFVNAELSEYLVIEDTFTNGRPPLEKAGIIFTDRDTVNQVETMKVTTCLNPLHTALAVSGCLLEYKTIADMMKDQSILNFIKTIGYDEGLKVVVDPGIIDPKGFIDEVVNERFANPNIPDTPERIATDTSQKVGIRFGQTIKAYSERDDLQASDLLAIPLAIAVWCRYLMGVNDQGETFDRSADPMLDSLDKVISDVKLGQEEKPDISGILSNDRIFGLDLYDVGLGQKIEAMFIQLIKGPGAVRKTIDHYFG